MIYVQNARCMETEYSKSWVIGINMVPPPNYFIDHYLLCCFKENNKKGVQLQD